MTRDPREEAERLVAAGLAAVSMAARGTTGFATGSAECCVCPLCRAIAAVRDPDPTFAERLASGAGDLATGLAGVLRAFADATAGDRDSDATAGDRHPDATGVDRHPDASTADRDHDGSADEPSAPPATPSSWSAATRTPPEPGSAASTSSGGTSGHAGFGNTASSGASAGTRKQAEPADDVWHAATAPPARPMAKKAVKKKAEPDA